jgi:polyhydroxyalkanoate synthesis regulator phasin
VNPFKKALYFGLGLVSLAGEKVNEKLNDIRDQAAAIADDLVERGEMTTEEARKFVDDLVKQAQQPVAESKSGEQSTGQAPRTIEILDDDESLANADPDQVQSLRDKVQELQRELQKIKQS